jgi:hypothetical protein
LLEESGSPLEKVVVLMAYLQIVVEAVVGVVEAVRGYL